MNFMANKKLYFTKTTTKKKLKQSKLDGFLKTAAPSRSLKANRSAMLQEFFMGAVVPRKEKPAKGTITNESAAPATADSTFVSGDNTGGFLESRVIMAITEGRSNARGEVGIAAIDVNSPELILCQLSDDMWYSGTIIKIQMLNPVEVLLPNTFFNAKLSNSKLLTILRSTFPTVEFKETPRKHFHDFEALSRIERISATNTDDVKIALENKYYALAACNALISYVGIAYYLNFGEKSLKVIYESRYAAMTIDMETSKRLELVTTLSPTNDKKTCLFTLMDNCMTRIGKRSLRARILEPFADLQMIKQCHEAIKELLDKENYQCTLRMILKKFYQVDRLMKLSLVTSLDDSIKASEAMISLTLMLKNCLTTIPMLVDILSSLDSSVFVGIRAGLEDTRYQLVLEHIDRILFTNEPQQNFHQSVYNQRINAVKPDVDQVLDLSRSFYSKIIDEITEMVKEMSVQYQMSFQLIHNASKGYQLSVMGNRTMLTYPAELQVVSRKGNKIIFTTDRMNDLNARLKRIVDDIMVTSNKIISEMLMNIRQEIDVVYLLTGIITELDLIQCFANLSRNSEFCCPTFGEETKIVDATHPFLEYGRLKTLPVPNQVMATPDHNLFMITGPNMGGKTVYIKMIAVLQVMAQVGCFVPADHAQFRICDKLFSRIGFEDSIDKGISSFGMEVEQMSFILNNVTPNSLVIIDELGRGTNPIEGQEWAWQMCEQLAVLKGFQSNGKFYVDDSRHEGTHGNSIMEARRPLKAITSPFVFVTTHFLELTKLADKFFNIVNLHLVAEEQTVNDNAQLTYTHKVQVGVTPLKEYGLALARTVKFPRKVMPKAEQILQKIKDQRVNELLNRSAAPNTGADGKGDGGEWTKEKLLYDLYSSIATICRQVSVADFCGDVDGDLKGILRGFGMKCSQDLRDSIRNRSLEETFNESRLFKKGGNETVVSDCTTQKEESIGNGVGQRDKQEQVQDEVDDSNETIPETPQSVLFPYSQESNVTNVTNTSWMTKTSNDSQKERTILSQVSYHSLLRRLAAKKDQHGNEVVMKNPFNEHKGFPVLPIVRSINGGATLDLNRDQRRQEIHSPDLFEDNDLLDQLPKTPPRRTTTDKERIETNQLRAGGDNRLLMESQNKTKEKNSMKKIEAMTRKKMSVSSFFDETILSTHDPDQLWDNLQTQIRMENQKSFKFDSPEQMNNTQQFFASQFEKSSQENPAQKFVTRNGRAIPCTVTSNESNNKHRRIDADQFRFDTTVELQNAQKMHQVEDVSIEVDSPDTLAMEKDLLNDFQEYEPNANNEEDQDNYSFSNAPNELLWTQESNAANEEEKKRCYGTQQCSSGSNYRFRLGLLSKYHTSSTPSQKPIEFNSQGHTSESFETPHYPPSTPSPASVRSGPQEFIAKYGKIVQENYKRSQSQSNQMPILSNKSSQNGAKDFLDKYGAKILENKLFKEPPVRFAAPPPKRDLKFSGNRHFNMNSSVSSISSIHSNEPPVTKKDYSEWLGQYCRSRVQSLGIVPLNRKRGHNSTIRSSKAKIDIESVNKKWESYYSEYNNNASSGSSSSSHIPEKRVSFSGAQGQGRKEH